jgi:uncharacterized membrane protein
MAFCPNCGAQVTGTYCPNCGTAVTGAGAASSSTSSAGTGYSGAAAPVASAPGLTENVASALCYLCGLITGIIFLVIAPYSQNKTVRFHAFQSIFASIALIILSIVLTIFFGILYSVTHIWSFWYLYRLYDLLVFIGWLYMMYTAYNNRKVKLPVVGDLAQKQA